MFIGQSNTWKNIPDPTIPCTEGDGGYFPLQGRDLADRAGIGGSEGHLLVGACHCLLCGWECWVAGLKNKASRNAPLPWMCQLNVVSEEGGIKAEAVSHQLVKWTSWKEETGSHKRTECKFMASESLEQAAYLFYQYTKKQSKSEINKFWWWKSSPAEVVSTA